MKWSGVIDGKRDDQLTQWIKIKVLDPRPRPLKNWNPDAYRFHEQPRGLLRRPPLRF